MNLDYDLMRRQVEREEKWAKSNLNAPILPANLKFNMKCITPYAGAFFRFVAIDEKTGRKISVYYDVLNKLGIMGDPYWEIYPIDGCWTDIEINDPERFLKGEEQDMIDKIYEWFNLE